MPPWLWTLLRRQSSIYCIVLCRLLAPAPALLGPARSVPCRSSECRGFGGCDRLHCRKTSECEGRGGRNCYRRLFLVTHTGKSWRRGGAAPAPRDFLSTRPQWLKVSEWEWEVCGCEAEEKNFIYPQFLSRRHQVSNWKRWQCLLLVDEWHLCRLSILLLLLELSKMSKLCLSILQILAWPASQHCQT